MNFLLAISLCQLALTASPPALVRIAVVDNSPSMAGDRIAAVRSELTEVIRQLPPSDAYPLMLIVFHGTVEPTQVFTSQQAAEQAVAKLNGDGTGTEIAPALVRGHDELQKYRATAAVLVMLFTDGEDPDQEAINRAEAKLDSLFAERTQHGLTQTVFVKRWGNANANLVARLQQQGHAQVLDAGELRIEPVTLIPAVQLLAARRSPEDPHSLQVAVVPTIGLRGSPPKAALSDFQFACRNSRATCNTPMRATPGKTGNRFVVAVPIPPTAEASDHLDLVFQVAPVRPTEPQTSFILPILPSSTVVVRVTLPALIMKNLLTAEIRAAEALQWEDPLRLRVRCRVTVAITVTAADKAISVDRGLTAEICPSAGVRLIGGSATLTIPKPGTYTRDVLLDVPALDSKASPRRTAPVELEIHTHTKVKSVTCEPATLCLRHVGLDVPSQVTTFITPVVKRISRPVWVDLVEPLASFDADVAFRVTGPIAQNTTLTLMVPGNVHGNVLPPRAQLHTGETVLTLKVLARLSPGKPERLEFQILAPPATPAVQYRVERGFSLSVVAPPAGRLIHRGAVPGAMAIDVSVADNQESAEALLNVDLSGIAREPLRRVPSIAVRPHLAPSAATITGQLFGALKLPLHIPPPENLSFFLDSQQTIDVDLEPAKPTVAVLPGRIQVIVHRQAPLKRLLVYLAWALFPVGLLTLAAHATRRFREPVLTLRDEPCNPPSSRS